MMLLSMVVEYVALPEFNCSVEELNVFLLSSNPELFVLELPPRRREGVFKEEKFPTSVFS